MYQKINYNASAFYAQSQKPTGQEKAIWIVFHGYGQLAPYFLEKFSTLFHENRLIIAPEATNYAYQKGFSGRVGANWMTKHHREQAIENNHHFLNAMLQQVLDSFKELPDINILGFSQGAATATRWAVQLSFSIKELVLWGGGFAHDLKIPDARKKLSQTHIQLVYGEKDPFLSEERLKEQQLIMRKLRITKETRHYPGGHDLYLPILREVFSETEGSD